MTSWQLFLLFLDVPFRAILKIGGIQVLESFWAMDAAKTS
jgi:hypothetical protein